MTFTTLLKEWKARTGWREEDIADKVGVGRVTVNAWLNARSLPKRENIAPLAKLLGLDAHTLFDMLGGQEAGESAMRPELAALLSKAATLTDGELTRVADVVEAMFPERLLEAEER